MFSTTVLFAVTSRKCEINITDNVNVIIVYIISLLLSPVHSHYPFERVVCIGL